MTSSGIPRLARRWPTGHQSGGWLGCGPRPGCLTSTSRSWVFRVWADESLLDSYEAERAPVGRAKAEASMHTAIGAAVDPLAHDFGVCYASSAIIGGSRLAGRRAPHAWAVVQDRRVSPPRLLGGL